MKKIDETITKISEEIKPEKHTVEYDNFDLRNFAQILDDTPKIRETYEEGSESYPQFKELHQDVFDSLYKYAPEKIEEKRIDYEYLLNSKVMDAVMKSPKYKEMRLLTRLDIVSSTMGTQIIGDQVKDLVNEREIIRVNKSKSSQDHIIYKKNETFLAKLKKDKVGQITYLGSIMFSSKLSNINFEEKDGMIDYDWVLKLFHNQKSVEVCIPLYKRRVDKDNLSLNINYRIIDYNHSIETTSQYIKEYPKEVMLSVKRINGSLARYYYLTGDMKLARKYFFKSEASFKHFLYVITTFVGSKLVKRHFNVFG